MLLLIISFIAGILTVLAPCVLPVLPVTIGGSIGANTRDRARPYVIAAALASSIVLFTLLLKASTVLVGLSPNVLTTISGGLVIALGLVSVVPELWERLMIRLNWEAASQRFLGHGERNKDKYIGPLLIGVALGPVFASCSPTYAFILASVLPHAFLSGLIYLIAYSLGLVLALLGLSLAGRHYIRRHTWAIDTHGPVRRAIGLLFVLIGLVIITGHEVSVETAIANHLPFDETKLEQLLLAKQKRTSLFTSLRTGLDDATALNVQPTPAPAFQGLTNWINSPPLTVAGLNGKVVLVDFWTYSCINCIRSIPYVEQWYRAYQKDGLVVVGVSTPEFAFEHNLTNVATAVEKYGITYPVALDNNYDTWNAYNNDSWPADYLIDKTGAIRYVSLGEGDYGKTERAIQVLLGINRPFKTPPSNVPITAEQTPETYFGTNRASDYVGRPLLKDGTATFVAADSLQPNEWTLSGTWQIAAQAITSEASGATLTFTVTAKDVYMVAGSTGSQPEPVAIHLPHGTASDYGSDAPDGVVTVSGSRLYHIVSLPKLDSTTVRLTVPRGVSLYTFTFGS